MIDTQAKLVKSMNHTSFTLAELFSNGLRLPILEKGPSRPGEHVGGGGRRGG